jgi:hypothetical protein
MEKLLNLFGRHAILFCKIMKKSFIIPVKGWLRFEHSLRNFSSSIRTDANAKSFCRLILKFFRLLSFIQLNPISLVWFGSDPIFPVRFTDSEPLGGRVLRKSWLPFADKELESIFSLVV